ncbi:MATE family efflux transporter [Marinobacterium jannaschii]|uniref:MATE family efflux transporter n=1 Tax=Marinobacterium jannaschii TaxID=64970 RepID=UPI00048A3A4E|nr:MATE family efflux transporter [Marinobacterium jannaschii]
MPVKTDLLKDSIGSVLVRMTLPMMMGIVSLMLFNIADVYFVGQLGTAPLAALGFTFPVTFSVVSLAIGLGIGTSATLAKLIGSGDQAQASSLSSDNLLLAALLTLLIAAGMQLLSAPLFTLMGAPSTLLVTIQEYMSIWLLGAVFLVVNMVANSSMRASGDTKTPAKIMAFSSVLNLILDPLLIFGWGPVPALGIQGAAIASVIAWGITTLMALHILYHHKKLLILQALELTRLRRHWLKVMKIGLPAALSNMMTPLASGVLTAVVASYGAEAVAAFGVGTRLESLSLLACLALSMTLPPFISQNYGAGQTARVARAWLLSVRFALVLQAVIYLLLILSAGTVARLFSDQAEVQELIRLWIWIVPLGFGFQAVTFLSASSFNALHQPMRAMRISVTRLFLLYVPLAWLGGYLAGLQGMFIGLVVANMLTAAVAAFWIRRHLNRLADSVATQESS